MPSAATVNSGLSIGGSHNPPNYEDKMVSFNAVIGIFFFTAFVGCSAQLTERSKEEGGSRAKQEEERKPSSIPTFTYRPGASLMIEGP